MEIGDDSITKRRMMHKALPWDDRKADAFLPY